MHFQVSWNRSHIIQQVPSLCPSPVVFSLRLSHIPCFQDFLEVLGRPLAVAFIENVQWTSTHRTPLNSDSSVSVDEERFFFFFLVFVFLFFCFNYFSPYNAYVPVALGFFLLYIYNDSWCGFFLWGLTFFHFYCGKFILAHHLKGENLIHSGKNLNYFGVCV